MPTIATPYNSTYKKLAVQCSADAFVVNQTFVLRINIWGKNRQLLVAANRYVQGNEEYTNNGKQTFNKRQKPAQTSIGLSDRPLFDLLKSKLTWRINKVMFAKTNFKKIIK